MLCFWFNFWHIFETAPIQSDSTLALIINNIPNYSAKWGIAWCQLCFHVETTQNTEKSFYNIHGKAFIVTYVLFVAVKPFDVAKIRFNWHNILQEVHFVNLIIHLIPNLLSTILIFCLHIDTVEVAIIFWIHSTYTNLKTTNKNCKCHATFCNCTQHPHRAFWKVNSP